MATDDQDEGSNADWSATPAPDAPAGSDAAFGMPPAQSLPPQQSIHGQGAAATPDGPSGQMPGQNAAPPWATPASQPTPGWPPAPGPQPTPGWPPAPGSQPAPGWPPAPGFQQAQGLPPAPGYPPAPGFSPTPGWPPAPGYPPASGYTPAPGFGPTSWPPTPGAPGFGPQPGYPPAPGYTPGGWPPPNPPSFGYQPPWPSPVQLGPAPGLTWGGIGVRVAAMLIDGVIMFVALIVAALIAEAFGVQHYLYRSDVYSPGASATYLVYFILLIAYPPTCWWAFQGTLGQRALGLRVVRASDGSSLGIGSTTVRFLLWAICTITVILGIIAAAMANDNPQKRTWWDDAAGSVVLRRA